MTPPEKHPMTYDPDDYDVVYETSASTPGSHQATQRPSNG
jgi:hypothetical protein